ncbi:hypothetical protein Tco_1006322 [Tanacetum coccineum]|uniref:Uncharacterized protein n=1 Tax=Tanacetum coccineum TaxID=301880 RepID=A0ABQ5FHZ0_9ASTR
MESENRQGLQFSFFLGIGVTTGATLGSGFGLRKTNLNEQQDWNVLRCTVISRRHRVLCHLCTGRVPGMEVEAVLCEYTNFESHVKVKIAIVGIAGFDLVPYELLVDCPRRGSAWEKPGVENVI